MVSTVLVGTFWKKNKIWRKGQNSEKASPIGFHLTWLSNTWLILSGTTSIYSHIIALDFHWDFIIYLLLLFYIEKKKKKKWRCKFSWIVFRENILWKSNRNLSCSRCVSFPQIKGVIVWYMMRQISFLLFLMMLKLKTHCWKNWIADYWPRVYILHQLIHSLIRCKFLLIENYNVAFKLIDLNFVRELQFEMTRLNNGFENKANKKNFE